MSSLFTKIIKQEIPSFKIYENELVYVFLDIFPVERGHLLVVSKQEVDKFYDVDDIYYQEVFKTVKLLAPILEKVMNAKRIAVKIEGWEIPHFHVHLVPVVNLEDNPLQKNGLKAEIKDLEEIQKKLLTELEKSITY